VVTSTLAVPALCDGVVKVMLVLVALVIVTAVPPMVTPVAPTKFVPVIITTEPPPSGPLGGEMPVTVGADW
jgi:hypothetical protein